MRKLLLLTFTMVYGLWTMDCSAQTPVAYNPYGEDELLFWGNAGIDVTTNNKMRVYKTVILDGNNYHMFDAPPGTHIVDARFKLSLGGSNGHIALVLLNNGKIYEARYVGGMGSYSQTELDPAPGSDVQQILGDDLYVMTYDAVYVSDSGYNWVLDNTGLGSPICSDIDIDTNQKVWLCANSALYTQDLNVTTWTQNTNYTGSGADLVYVDRLQNVWVSYFNQLRVTTNGGLSFANAPTGLYSGYIRDIADDAFGNIYVMWDGRLYYSANGTQPFVRIDLPVIADFTRYGNSPVYNDVYGDTLLYLSTVAGLYTSADQGTTWVYDNQVHALHINSVAATADSRLLMTSNTGLHRMETHDNWTRRYPTTGFVADTKVYAATNGDLYLLAERAGTNTGGSFIQMVYKSTDDGDTFLPDTNGVEAADVAMSVFFTDENGVQHAAASVNQGGYYLRVWKKNPGSPWELDDAGLPANMNFNYSAVCFGSDNSGKVYLAITNNGIATVYSRPIAGGTWTSETTVNGYVYGIKGRNGIATIASSYGVSYKTTGSWQTIPRPSGVSQYIDWCLTEVDNNGIIWAYYEVFDNASTGEGIYYSEDLATWNNMFASIDTILFGELVALGDSVYGLTAGNDGVFVFFPDMLTNLATINAEELNVLVSPNPTRGLATMQFTLDNESKVELNIYNILGETVYQIAPKQLNAGTHQLELRLPELAKGTLLWNLSVNGEVLKGKIIRE
jgi:hypothetical protein